MTARRAPPSAPGLPRAYIFTADEVRRAFAEGGILTGRYVPPTLAACDMAAKELNGLARLWETRLEVTPANRAVKQEVDAKNKRVTLVSARTLLKHLPAEIASVRAFAARWPDAKINETMLAPLLRLETDLRAFIAAASSYFPAPALVFRDWQDDLPQLERIFTQAMQLTNPAEAYGVGGPLARFVQWVVPLVYPGTAVNPEAVKQAIRRARGVTLPNRPAVAGQSA